MDVILILDSAILRKIYMRYKLSASKDRVILNSQKQSYVLTIAKLGAILFRLRNFHCDEMGTNEIQ